MCGILGSISNPAHSDRANALAGDALRAALQTALQTLAHRGPDAGGLAEYPLTNARVFLGHRRLAILDLSAQGEQPMNYAHLSLTYNGEIYNFHELRRELEQRGYQFDSNTDTEVLLKGWHCEGPAFIDHLVGMFAFAMLDRRDNRLYLVRDRSGVKPLYYSQTPGHLTFASELKALRSLPTFDHTRDPEALSLFFKLAYIPAPHSIYRHARKVLPGHWLCFDLNSSDVTRPHYQPVQQCYWQISDYYQHPKLTLSYEEALEATEEKLITACKRRLIADVPVGIFLSGGYDSSAVAALLRHHTTQPIKTFTVAFDDDNFDESPYAQRYAQHLGTDHHTFHASEDALLDQLPRLAQIYDEPFGDSSALPTMLLAQQVKSEIGVVLSADGGDELFAGYDSYLTLPGLLQKQQQLSRLGFASPLIRGLARLANNPTAHGFARHALNIENYPGKLGKLRDILGARSLNTFMLNKAAYFSDHELKQLLPDVRLPNNLYGIDALANKSSANTAAPLPPLEQLLCFDYQHYLGEDILTKVDRATMAVSLEGREPLLDHELVEFVAQLPTDYKLNNGQRKRLLKDIVHRYLPETTMQRKKQGFSVPLAHWYDKQAKPFFLDHLSDSALKHTGLLCPQYCQSLLKRYAKGEKMLIHKIWLIVVAQQWLHSVC